MSYLISHQNNDYLKTNTNKMFRTSGNTKGNQKILSIK